MRGPRRSRSDASSALHESDKSDADDNAGNRKLILTSSAPTTRSSKSSPTASTCVAHFGLLVNVERRMSKNVFNQIPRDK